MKKMERVQFEIDNFEKTVIENAQLKLAHLERSIIENEDLEDLKFEDEKFKFIDSNVGSLNENNKIYFR